MKQYNRYKSFLVVDENSKKVSSIINESKQKRIDGIRFNYLKYLF